MVVWVERRRRSTRHQASFICIRGCSASSIYTCVAGWGRWWWCHEEEEGVESVRVGEREWV